MGCAHVYRRYYGEVTSLSVARAAQNRCLRANTGEPLTGQRGAPRRPRRRDAARDQLLWELGRPARRRSRNTSSRYGDHAPAWDVATADRSRAARRACGRWRRWWRASPASPPTVRRVRARPPCRGRALMAANRAARRGAADAVAASSRARRCRSPKTTTSCFYAAQATSSRILATRSRCRSARPTTRS